MSPVCILKKHHETQRKNNFQKLYFRSNIDLAVVE